MKQEIPAFVYFLKNRKLLTKRESRMHFNPDLLKTDVFMDTVRVNEPSAATDLREQVKELFIDNPGKQELLLPMKNIREEFFTPKTSVSWIQEMLTDYLGVTQLTGKDGKAVVKRGEYTKYIFDEYADGGEGAMVPKTIKWLGRPYVFDREKFIAPEEEPENDQEWDQILNDF
jgi:hypothetical protein